MFPKQVECLLWETIRGQNTVPIKITSSPELDIELADQSQGDGFWNMHATNADVYHLAGLTHTSLFTILYQSFINQTPEDAMLQPLSHLGTTGSLLQQAWEGRIKVSFIFLISE